MAHLLRTSALTIVVVALPLALAASCSGGHDASPTDAGTPETSEANTADSTASTADAALCPPPVDGTARCTGNDATFVFFPPLDCNLATLGEDAGVDAGGLDGSTGAASDAGLGPCYGVSTFDVAFTPAACSALLTAESRGLVSTNGGSRAPQILEPEDGAMLTPDNWSLFAWSPAMARRSPMQHLVDWIEPSAYATSPLDGEGYVLEFSEGCVEFLRVMVASPFWEPDPASWSLLSSRTGSITVRVIGARFVQNAIAPGTVALASAPVTITMMQ